MTTPFTSFDNIRLNKATIEPNRAHDIGAYQAGWGFILVDDLEAYAFFTVKSNPDGTEPLEPPVLVIESGNIELQRTPGKLCLINVDGVLKSCNDRSQNVNIGYFFVPYKFE